MLFKCCPQYASNYRKLSSGHRTGKGQFSFQSQRSAMPKNVQTTKQQCSFHMLARLWLKILQAMPQQYVNQELPDVQAGFRKGRGTGDQTANICWIIEKARELKKKKQTNTSTSTSLTTLKPLTVWIATNRKIL